MIDREHEEHWEYWNEGIWDETGTYLHWIAGDSAIPSDKIDSCPELYEQILQRRALQQIAQELSKISYLLKTQLDVEND
jgi:hypothetical protein